MDSYVRDAILSLKNSKSSKPSSSLAADSDDDDDDTEQVTASDKTFERFSRRIQRSPLQCARYAYEGKPLFSDVFAEPSVPNCEGCGGRRLFEFQLMPQCVGVLGLDEGVGGAKGGDDEGKRLVELLGRSGVVDGSVEGEKKLAKEVVEAGAEKKEGGGKKMELPKLDGTRFEKGIDWGVLCVYVCENSCGGDGIRTEVVVVQPPVK